MAANMNFCSHTFGFIEVENGFYGELSLINPILESLRIVLTVFKYFIDEKVDLFLNKIKAWIDLATGWKFCRLFEASIDGMILILDSFSLRLLTRYSDSQLLFLICFVINKMFKSLLVLINTCVARALVARTFYAIALVARIGRSLTSLTLDAGIGRIGRSLTAVYFDDTL